MFARYTGGDAEAEATLARYFWPYVAAISQRAVVGTGCCRACWHAYRRSQLVANDPGRAFLVDNLGGTATESFESADGQPVSLVTLPDGPDPVAVSRLIRDLVPGAEVSPNYVMKRSNHGHFFPHSLPRPPEPPPLEPPARAEPNDNVSVVVIDTGCIEDHSWWGDRVTPVDEKPPDTGDPVSLVRGHGTFIVGLLRRFAPAVKIIVKRVPEGDGLTEFEVARELMGAAALEPNVINVSLGTCALDGLPPVAMAAAIDYVERQRGDDLVIVAAAGNDGTDQVVYPAAYNGVVGVGAVDDQDRRQSYSNFGPWVQACAAGSWVSAYFGEGHPVEIEALGTFEGFARWEGTSFATAVVAAQLANAVAVDRQQPRSALHALLGRGGTVPGVGHLVRPQA